MSFKIKWWQLLIYETALIAVGILIGAKWEAFFADYFYILLSIFAVLGGYVLYVLTSQIDFKEKQ